MKLEHRFFSGKNFRPSPSFLLDEGLNLFAIATPWGPAFQTKKTLNFLVQNYENLTSDEEKTNIYSPLQSLSPDENLLRSLILSCNEWIFKEQNHEKEYIFGYELFCGNFKSGKMIFSQIGQPFVYLDRPDLPLQSLGSVLDFSASFSKGERLAPLPSHLMGIYPDSHFPILSFPIAKGDRLLFISRDFAPASILDIPHPDRNLDHILSLLTKEDAKSPCWIGHLSF